VTSDVRANRPAGQPPAHRPPTNRQPTDQRRPDRVEGARRPAGNNVPTAGSTLVMPAAAAAASICAATAISGIVGGVAWLSYVIVVVVVIAATGTALRALRVPAPVIWIGQVFVLLCLAVTLFTNTGLFVLLPGPQALHDLGVVFGQAGSEVQTGVPPVDADQPILCLVMLSMGLVAVAVDTLAVTARVPAAAGLILLCVYAVPASLDDAMLPWWSFVLGAGAFTVMLAVDGVQRHQSWRGKLGLPAVATTGVAPATTAVTAAGVVLALFVGATFTLIGTVGRLPGADSSGTVGTGALGIKPFTVLSGMLDQKATTELFDVTGLPTTPPYLQALTLDDYEAARGGWVRGTQMPAGVQATSPLPYAPGRQAGDPTTKVTISAVNWEDVWLPVFGMPAALQGVSQDYRYDKDSGIVYSEQTRRPGNYVEQADLTEPTAAALRSASQDYSQISPKYTRITGVDHRVEDLARQITSGAGNEFDMAEAVYSYFRAAGNDFTYSTQTAKPVTGDALVDFLFYGKTGFCEQYASAMGAMLRTLGIPTRVAIGFTAGYEANGHRTITSQDAHAWDEVYFPGYGWVTFDPTPLTDGRAQVPGFVGTSQSSGGSNSTARQNPDRENGNPSVSPTTATTAPAPVNTAQAQAAGGWSGPPVWELCTVLILALAAGATTFLARRGRAAGGMSIGRHWRLLAAAAWCLLVFFAAALFSWWLSALVLVLGLAAAPAAVREVRRRRRHRTVVQRGPGAADAAWAELLAESWDRGTSIPPSDTLRVAAHRMVREHGLDHEGRESLRTLVGEVERSWYGTERPPSGAADRPTAPVVVESFDKVRGSLHRNAPLAFRARLLPKSVLRPARTRARDSDTGIEPDNDGPAK
jgi:transglutaminase-like putative cysteine protease